MSIQHMSQTQASSLKPSQNCLENNKCDHWRGRYQSSHFFEIAVLSTLSSCSGVNDAHTNLTSLKTCGFWTRIASVPQYQLLWGVEIRATGKFPYDSLLQNNLICASNLATLVANLVQLANLMTVQICNFSFEDFADFEAAVDRSSYAWSDESMDREG